jgi:CheY-like chemotaxis protein
MNRQPLKILLMENDPEDGLIIQMVLKNAPVPNRLYVVKSEREALHFLFQRGKYAGGNGAPRPDFILLGINGSNIDGLDVVRRLKTNPRLKQIPVTILTRSNGQAEISKGYDLGVNCCVQKPSEFQSFVRTIRSLYRYWAVLATLPP